MHRRIRSTDPTCSRVAHCVSLGLLLVAGGTLAGSGEDGEGGATTTTDLAQTFRMLEAAQSLGRAHREHGAGGARPDLEFTVERRGDGTDRIDFVTDEKGRRVAGRLTIRPNGHGTCSLDITESVTTTSVCFDFGDGAFDATPLLAGL